MTESIPRLTLVLGGARSGKSAFAETMAEGTGLRLIYLATGRAFDAEMKGRIDLHRKAREGRGWSTLEEPLDLAGALVANANSGSVVLVDCLTLWLTNLMMAERKIASEFAMLADALSTARWPIIFVSNEVGLGIVPNTAMGRAFRDHAGRLHQKIAGLADCVYFVAAGLPLKMKG
jgi:adenosylcobinamide kinase/adenosylcobinamide-phosphate guanylyltransferase